MEQASEIFDDTLDVFIIMEQIIDIIADINGTGCPEKMCYMILL